MNNENKFVCGAVGSSKTTSFEELRHAISKMSEVWLVEDSPEIVLAGPTPQANATG